MDIFKKVNTSKETNSSKKIGVTSSLFEISPKYKGEKKKEKRYIHYEPYRLKAFKHAEKFESENGYLIELGENHIETFLRNFDQVTLKPYSIHISPNKCRFTHINPRKDPIKNVYSDIKAFYNLNPSFNKFIIHPENGSDAPDRWRIRLLEERIGRLMEELKSNKVKCNVFLENLNHYTRKKNKNTKKWYIDTTTNYFWNIKELVKGVESLRDVGFSNLFICLDVGHLHKLEYIFNLNKEKKQLIRHLHVHAPKEGEIIKWSFNKRKLRFGKFPVKVFYDAHNTDLSIFQKKLRNDFFKKLFREFTSIETIIFEPVFFGHTIDTTKKIAFTSELERRKLKIKNMEKFIDLKPLKKDTIRISKSMKRTKIAKKEILELKKSISFQGKITSIHETAILNVYRITVRSKEYEIEFELVSSIIKLISEKYNFNFIIGKEIKIIVGKDHPKFEDAMFLGRCSIFDSNLYSFSGSIGGLLFKLTNLTGDTKLFSKNVIVKIGILKV